MKKSFWILIIMCFFLFQGNWCEVEESAEEPTQKETPVYNKKELGRRILRSYTADQRRHDNWKMQIDSVGLDDMDLTAEIWKYTIDEAALEDWDHDHIHVAWFIHEDSHVWKSGELNTTELRLKTNTTTLNGKQLSFVEGYIKQIIPKDPSSYKKGNINAVLEPLQNGQILDINDTLIEADVWKYNIQMTSGYDNELKLFVVHTHITKGNSVPKRYPTTPVSPF